MKALSFLHEALVKKPSSRGPACQCRAARRARSGAFTIAEVMVAATVMALAITTSITTMQRGYLALDGARNITLAGQIMQSELEKMRLKSWDTVAGYASGTQPATLTIDTVFTSNATIGNRFSMTRTVTTAHTDMLEIVLTITWNSYDGRPQSRSYKTYYGKNGLYDFFYNSY